MVSAQIETIVSGKVLYHGLQVALYEHGSGTFGRERFDQNHRGRSQQPAPGR